MSKSQNPLGIIHGHRGGGLRLSRLDRFVRCGSGGGGRACEGNRCLREPPRWVKAEDVEHGRVSPGRPKTGGKAPGIRYLDPDRWSFPPQGSRVGQPVVQPQHARLCCYLQFGQAHFTRASRQTDKSHHCHHCLRTANKLYAQTKIPSEFMRGVRLSLGASPSRGSC